MKKSKILLIEKICIFTIFLLLAILPSSYAQEYSFITFSMGKTPVIFNMDYQEEGIHYFGEDYHSRIDFKLGISGTYEKKERTGLTGRFGINFANKTSFKLNFDYKDPEVNDDWQKFTFTNLYLDFGGHYYYQIQPLIIQPYMSFIPLGLLTLSAGGGSGYSFYIGAEGGIEIFIKLFHKIHLLLSGGYTLVTAKNPSFNMTSGYYSGSTYYYWEQDVEYEGTINKQIFGHWAAGIAWEL